MPASGRRRRWPGRTHRHLRAQPDTNILQRSPVACGGRPQDKSLSRNVARLPSVRWNKRDKVAVNSGTPRRPLALTWDRNIVAALQRCFFSCRSKSAAFGYDVFFKTTKNRYQAKSRTSFSLCMRRWKKKTSPVIMILICNI